MYIFSVRKRGSQEETRGPTTACGVQTTEPGLLPSFLLCHSCCPDFQHVQDLIMHKLNQL